MSAAPPPDLDALLVTLDALSHSERLREAARFARAHASDPALAAALERLLAGGAHEAALAVVMARAVRRHEPLLRALEHRSLRVRRLAIDGLVALARVGEAGPDLAALALALPLALRRALIKAQVRRGRRAVGRALFPALLARFGPREAALLLPVLEDSQLRTHLPTLAHAVASWRSLYLRHPAAVRDHLADRLAEASERDQTAVWQRHAAVVHALAELEGAALFDLLARFPDTCHPSLLWSRLGDLARADAGRLLDWLERPGARDWLARQGLPRRLLNQLPRFSAAQRIRLGRLVSERPELLAPLLARVAPGQREALLDGVYAGHELATRVWPDVLLDSLPRALQRREAARMRGLAIVQADPDRAQALAAYLEPAAADPILRPALRAADAELRARAVARVIACAGRDGSLSAALAVLGPRLRNDQDPVRLQAFTALARVPPRAFVEADAEPLRALVTAATEARDTSYTTRQHVQALAFRLLRSHAARDVLFGVGLDLLRLLAGQTGTLQLPDLSSGLPRRGAPEIVAALAPRIAAANARERPELVLALATALGRRRFGLTALDELLAPLARAKPDAVAARAITLLLAEPARRDERVRELLAWDPSVITLRPALLHLHRRRQAWLDPYLDGRPIKGRFRSGDAVLLYGLADGFHRWLPRQQRAYLRLLQHGAGDRKAAHHSRAGAIAQLAALPIVGAAELAPYVASDEVPIAEAALGALAWIDAPDEALPLLLANLDGDRARVAMYALPRVARHIDGATLASALLALIAGPGRKVTVRKEALRLLGEHRSAASVPTLQAALAREDLHKDVAVAIGHAARSLLDDPRALELLTRLARSPEPDIARSLLQTRPDLLPAAGRPGYAALVRGLARHPDLTTRRLAVAALPTWSLGQEAEIAGELVEISLDLAAGDAWSEACAALVTVGASGRAGDAWVRAAAGLAARAGEPGPADRDLPAAQRLLALCRALQREPIDLRLRQHAAHAAVADALVADELWPLAAGLRISALDLADVPLAAAALTTLAADARADLFLGSLITCLKGQLTELRARALPPVLLDLAAALAGAAPPAARLAVVVLASAGARADWPEAARALLERLRAHADLRVRHAARQVFTRPEAPGLATAEDDDDLDDSDDDDDD